MKRYKATEAPSNIPFRIRLGVTGHRNLQEPEKIAERIRTVLSRDIFGLIDDESKNAIAESPNTEIKYSILTSLAQGADQLVAKEVLAFNEDLAVETIFGLRKNHCGWPTCKISDPMIEVALPMAREEYLNSFDPNHPEAKIQFEDLFKMARRPITLGSKRLGVKFSNQVTGSNVRKSAYLNAGNYVVDNCDVLIALWDGQPSRGRGGTAEIVDYAKRMMRPIVVISTVTPYNVYLEKGRGLNARSITLLEGFNAYPIKIQESSSYIENVCNDLFNNPEASQFTIELKQTVKDKLLPFYVKASLIAKRNQEIYRYAGSLVYLLSAGAIAFTTLGVLFQNLAAYAFFAEFILLLFILVVVIRADRKRAHKKWIENRFLAERIRSAIFFAMCGVEASPIDVPPLMQVAHQPNDWMVKVFSEVWNSLPPCGNLSGEHPGHYGIRYGTGGDYQAILQYVRNHWIRPQIEFHKRKSRSSGKMSKGLEWGGIVVFFVAMSAALAHFVVAHFEDVVQHKGFEHLLTFLALVLPATGAAIGGIRSHREYSRMAKRSENMEILLEGLDSQFESCSGPQELEILLREAEEIMVRETQDWLVLMRFVELKPSA